MLFFPTIRSIRNLQYKKCVNSYEVTPGVTSTHLIYIYIYIFPIHFFPYVFLPHSFVTSLQAIQIHYSQFHKFHPSKQGGQYCTNSGHTKVYEPFNQNRYFSMGCINLH